MQTREFDMLAQYAGKLGKRSTNRLPFRCADIDFGIRQVGEAPM